MTVNLSEAKAHLGRYVAKAAEGEIITICERNRPVAELHPAPNSRRPRKLTLGTLKVKLDLPEDFNASLPDFEGEFYGKARKRASKSK